jgi:hypothetical protein
MTRASLVGTVLGVAFACAGATAGVGEVKVLTYDSGSVSQVQLPGGLVGYALPRDGSGNKEIIVLVGPSKNRPKKDPDRPEVIRGEEGVPAHAAPVEGLHLFRFDPSRDGALELLDGNVHEGSSSVRRRRHRRDPARGAVRALRSRSGRERCVHKTRKTSADG